LDAEEASIAALKAADKNRINAKFFTNFKS
jgi:hypothetical protein